MNNIKYFGLVGKDIGYSRSPQIHNDIFKKTGRENCCYNIIDIPDSAALYLFYKQQMQSFMYRGVNVTIPYKIEIMPFLDHIEENARYIGSVNTILFHKEDDVLVSTGYNTDYTGFIESLVHHNVDVKGKSIVILGTGGVSRAVSKALIDLGVGDIAFVSTSPARYDAVKIMTYHEFKTTKQFYDIIINCTPKSIVSLQLCPAFLSGHISTGLFYDLNYFSTPDDFMLTTDAFDVKSINGSYMLTAQAKASQDIWFGKKDDA